MALFMTCSGHQFRGGGERWEGAGGRKGLKLTSIWNPNGFSVQMDRECVWNQSSKRKDIGTISALVQFCSSTLKKHK